MVKLIKGKHGTYVLMSRDSDGEIVIVGATDGGATFTPKQARRMAAWLEAAADATEAEAA